MKVLVVVDMQNDFIDGALGTKEAQAVLPRVVEKVRIYPGYPRERLSSDSGGTQASGGALHPPKPGMGNP